MKPSQLKYIAIFNLLLGVTLLLSFVLSGTAVVRGLDDAFYKLVAVAKGELSFSSLKDAVVERKYVKEGANIVSVHWELTPYLPARDMSVVMVEVGDDPDNIFHDNPMSPMDYTSTLYNIRDGDNKLVSRLSVTSPMVWPPPVDPIIQGTLVYEVVEYEKVRLGLVLSPSSKKYELPKSLSSLVLQPEQIKGGISYLMGVGRVVEYPLIKDEGSVTYVPLRVETEELVYEKEGSGKRLSLFVRWGNYVLPTLPLMTALDGLNLGISDVKVEFGGELNLGGKRIIPIDVDGSIAVSPKMKEGVVRISATELIQANISALNRENTKRLKNVLSTAQVVLLGEGETPVRDLGLDKVYAPLQLDRDFDATASGVVALLGALAPAEVFSLAKMGKVGQFMALLNVLLFSTWALTFTRALRRCVFVILFVGSLLIGFCLSYYESLWLPLFAPLLGVILAGIYAEFAGRGSGESEESEELNMEEEELNPVPPPSTYKRKKEEKQEIHPTAEVEEDIAAQEGNEEGVSAEGDSSEEMEEPLTLDEAIIQPPSLKPPGKTRTTQKLRRMKKSQTKHKGREK